MDSESVASLLPRVRKGFSTNRMTHRPDPTRLSATLLDALNTDADGHITVGEVLDRVAERGFGLLLFVVALPTMIPVLPPGASAVVGIIYIVLGLQILAGFAYPWLPRAIRAHRLSPTAVKALRQRGVAFLERIERMTRPRRLLLESGAMLRVFALLIVLNGVILFLPVPFMNTLPAIGIMLIGIGMLNRDGLFLLAGGAIGTVSITIVISSAHLLIKAQSWLRSLL